MNGNDQMLNVDGDSLCPRAKNRVTFSPYPGICKTLVGGWIFHIFSLGFWIDVLVGGSRLIRPKQTPNQLKAPRWGYPERNEYEITLLPFQDQWLVGNSP